MRLGFTQFLLRQTQYAELTLLQDIMLFNHIKRSKDSLKDRWGHTLNQYLVFGESVRHHW